MVQNYERQITTESDDELRRAADMLSEIEVSSPREEELIYFANVVISHPDAVEDDRLVRQREDESHVQKKHHRHDGDSLPWEDGSTTSWGFILSEGFRDEWNKYRAQIVNVAPTDNKDEILAVLEKMQEHIFEELKRNMLVKGSILVEHLSDKQKQLSPEELQLRFICAGSGGKGINAFMELFEWVGKKAQTFAEHFQETAIRLTSDENGSEVTSNEPNVWGHTPSYLSVHTRDPKNIAFGDTAIATAYEDGLDDGATRISLTAMPKTGVDYLGKKRAVDQVLQRRVKTDEQNHIPICLDLIQEVGRVPSQEVYSVLKDPQLGEIVDADISTYSKAYASLPHASVIHLTEGGYARLVSFFGLYKNDPEFLPWLQRIVDTYQISYSPLLAKYGAQFKGNALSAVRMNDGLHASWDAEAKESPWSDEKFQLWSQRAKDFAEVYKSFFRNLGFNILSDERTVTSTISFEIPVDTFHLLPSDIGGAFLEKLAELGVSLGGILQTKGSPVPILRFGLPIRLLRYMEDGRLLTPDELRKKLYDTELKYLEALSFARLQRKGEK